MKAKFPTIERVLELLDSPDESVVGGNEILLRTEFGIENLIPIYASAFSKINHWPGRMHISFVLTPYVKKYEDIFNMAVVGIFDRSKIVRNYCCSILAYSQDKKALPYLESLAKSKHKSSYEDAIAAIAAIQQKNHNLWADREGVGNVFWQPKYV